MIEAITNKLNTAFRKGYKKSFRGTLQEWCYDNLTLPSSYSMPGRVDISASPYLVQPSIDLLDPKIRQLNFIAGVQTGKSFLSEIYVPYLIANNPSNVLRIHQNADIAAFFNKNRLAPILESCPAIAPFLKSNRFAVKKDQVELPHCNIKCVGPSENNLHGITVRTLILDEAHVYEQGVISKAIARTNAFSQNRKIIICSQPNQVDTDLHRAYESGNIYDWQWCCPSCKAYQPYRWTHKRDDGTFSGLNWESILDKDGDHTNIGLSARTAWLECDPCRYRVADTITNRRLLNDTGKYVCIKSDGDSAVRSYTWSGFVNIGLSFEYFANLGMTAKRTMKRTGIKDEWVNFLNQVYGRFYKQEQTFDQSKIIVSQYSDSDEYKDGIKILTVDVQKNGTKYYIVRNWAKNGLESRRLAFGICRTWDEVQEVADKYKVSIPCVGIDSGHDATEVYAESIRRGKVITLPNGSKHYASWTCLKGDQKSSYKHKDGVLRLYSEEVKGDAAFPIGDKFKGIPAKLYLWSNYSIKTILAKLRDNDMKGVKWYVDAKDSEYDTSMYSEGIVEVVNKRTGMTEPRWIMKNNFNHYWDCECMNLAMAVMFHCFSPTNVDTELVGRLSKAAIMAELEHDKISEPDVKESE